ncbi:MAG TPA: paraquat-inducible protein A [Sedimenticola sp.]|nr:paraquat-inducible protein A [Sedimenticola sp.]
MQSSGNQKLIACHECDALQQTVALPPGGVARCRCCGALLYSNPRGGLDAALAFSLSTLILFLIANIYPLLILKVAGQSSDTTLSGASLSFYQAGMPELALVVWLTSVVTPAAVILSDLYVLTGLRFRIPLPGTRTLLAWTVRLQPWGMMDVFMLGILVSLVKLSGMAEVKLGTGLYAFVILIFLFAAAASRFEPRLLWERLEQIRGDRAK